MQKIFAKQALLEGGWQNNVLLTIGEAGQIDQIETEGTRGDITVDLLLPAPVNAHSHSFQRAMSGWTETRGPDPKDSFWTWRKLMYQFLDQLTPDQIEAIAALAFMEMLEAGYASVAEFHYLHNQIGGVAYDNRAELSERIISAAEQTGIGLTLLPVLYQYGGCDKRELEGGQKRFSNTPDTFADLHALATQAVAQSLPDYNIGVAPHSLRAVDLNSLQAVAKMNPAGPVHMHLAEQIPEVEETLEHFGARPIEWLFDQVDVNNRWCLIHCTQMNDAETLALARSDAVAGLCPITESSLGDGIFNGAAYTKAGGKLAVGSDSNIHIALFNELCTLEYSQRLATHGRATLATSDMSNGRFLYDAACQNGAQATQRNSGQIKPGALADLIGVETGNHWINNSTGDRALDCLIFGGHGQRCITDVWSAGRHMVQNGRHNKRAEIISAYRSVIDQLRLEI